MKNCQLRISKSIMKLFRTNAEPLTDLCFDTTIARMKREIEQKRNATENFSVGWLAADSGNFNYVNCIM